MKKKHTKPNQEESLTFWDRLACGFAGAIFGVVYGCLLAMLAWRWNWPFPICGKIVMTSMGIFGVLGILMGTFVGELMGDMLHVFLALASRGNSETFIPEDCKRQLFRAFLVLIVGTVIVMYWHQ